MDFEAIKKAAQAYGPDMTRFLRDMIAIPSESCEEKGVAHRIAEEMKKLVESGEYVPSYMWNQNGWLCSKMGLHVASQTQKCIPCVDREDLKSDTLGMVVKAGDATGMRAVVTTETKEGITLVTECVGKIYNPEETDKNVWTLHGEPNTTCIVNEPATVELTCATLVNRIPQLIDAPAGYVTTDRFPYNEYMVHPMNTYVKTK